MNFLAKHFFDYQSFVNLPQKAIQLHKTPYSEAGTDPSASWAPKNMQVQGKNYAAPAARANRNTVEAKPGCHRHGRPSKLEFRRWGERHGELKEERIIPHKDQWMASLEGDFKHFHEVSDDEEDIGANETAPACMKNKSQMDAQILVILTLTTRLEFVSVTVKTLKGLTTVINPFVKVQHFEGPQLLEERSSSVPRPESAPHDALQNGPTGRRLHSSPQLPHNNNNHLVRSPRRVVVSRQGSGNHSLGESFLLKIPQNRLFCSYIVIQVFGTRLFACSRPSAENPAEVETVVEERVEQVGCCVIGANKASSRGVYHWRQMLRKHGQPVCAWHYLYGQRTQHPTHI